jgi:hypothetical protein
MINRIKERISKVKPHTMALCFLVFALLLLVTSITLTVFFAIDKSKYETSHGTFLSTTDNGPAIRYVVKGLGYVESIRNVPGSWKNQALVEIEYKIEEPESVRAIRSATPYIIAIFASAVSTGWAIYISRKYPLLKNNVPGNNDNVPTEIGGYYS